MMDVNISLYEECFCRGNIHECKHCNGGGQRLNDLGREVKELIAEVLREELPAMLRNMRALGEIE